MRTLGFSAVMVFSFFAVLWPQKKEGKTYVSPLAGLKPWEVPFVHPAVHDTIGAVDTLFLELKKGEKEGDWIAEYSAFTDEPLFALSFTLRHDSLMSFDSISLVGTRCQFFQTQMVNRPPEVPNTITVGLFSAMNPHAPALEPGRGPVLKLFFRAPASRPISVRSVAPINMPPGLEFVTPQATPIHPVVVRVGDTSPVEKAAPDKTDRVPTKKKKN